MTAATQLSRAGRVGGGATCRAGLRAEGVAAANVTFQTWASLSTLTNVASNPGRLDSGVAKYGSWEVSRASSRRAG